MKTLRGFLGTSALLAWSGIVSAQMEDMPGGPRVNQLNLPDGVTQIARDIQWLHWMLLIVCAAIFVGVFGTMVYSLIMHRKSRHPTPAQFHEHIGVEIAWTVVPFIIVIAMALPATRTVVAMKDTTSADLTVKVTGYQWKWGYEYIDGPAQGVKFLSNLSTPRAQIDGDEPRGTNYLMEVDNPLVVPVDKKVRIVLTSDDVIHAWMVPHFGVKQDAMPGFLRDTWFRADTIGTYRGQCAELCGKDHAFMPIVVDVVSQADYEKWSADQQKALAQASEDPDKVWETGELVAHGEKVYAAHCVACHQADGQGMPPVFPALDGSDASQGPMQEQILTVLNGVPGTAMAAFRDQLSDTEIAAAITYTRNAWSNAGQGEDPVVQPADVQAAR